MRSSLYRVQIQHTRTSPVKRKFSYRIFLFSVELTELENFNRKFGRLLTYNRAGVFSFHDNDHLRNIQSGPRENTLHKVRNIFAIEGLGIPDRVYLVTSLRVFGYVFNPVSFYYGYSRGRLCGIIVEVNNTFHEQKLYLIAPENISEKGSVTVKKDFYVSPFIDDDRDFRLKLNEPSTTINIRIDTIENSRPLLIATMKGSRRNITALRLLGYLFRFPFVTVKVIILIHYQALILFLRKIPYFKKADSDAALMKRGRFGRILEKTGSSAEPQGVTYAETE